MLRLNKEMWAAQREFLDWLVPTLKILLDKEGRVGIDVLTGKAKLADYPGDYQKGEPALSLAEVLEILRKNRQRLGVSLTIRDYLTSLRAGTRPACNACSHSRRCSDKTDALIDAVVYRLYGLTEEEIRVVERDRK